MAHLHSNALRHTLCSLRCPSISSNRLVAQAPSLVCRISTRTTRRISTTSKLVFNSRAVSILPSFTQTGQSFHPVSSGIRQSRTFHATSRCLAGGTDYNPESLPMDDYHSIANETLDAIVEEVEAMVEDAEKAKGLDVEYSSGVMTLTTPNGTYVINKQPPNKQIWLSSPVSGPKRYDWVPSENGGEWVYARDGSTLHGLLEEEVGIEIER